MAAIERLGTRQRMVYPQNYAIAYKSLRKTRGIDGYPQWAAVAKMTSFCLLVSKKQLSEIHV